MTISDNSLLYSYNNLISLWKTAGLNQNQFGVNGYAVNQVTDNSFSSLLSGIMAAEDEQDSIAPLTAEQSLKVKYPSLKYHVVDGTQFKYWNRLDFPISEVYKDNMDTNRLAKWKPTTPYSNGREPHVQADLETIPDGSYSVIIHPDVQIRMNNDPEYAKRIERKIDEHFQRTIALNEAIVPGCTKGMSQAVVIDKDGQIYFQASSSRATKDKDENNEETVKETKAPIVMPYSKGVITQSISWPVTIYDTSVDSLYFSQLLGGFGERKKDRSRVAS